MATATFELERARIAADPNQYEAISDFDGSVRSVDVMGFNEGDTIQLPADMKAETKYKQKIGENFAQFILVKTNDDDNDVRRFYPSCMTKIAFPCDSTGKLLDSSKRKVASGTAADIYRQHGSINDGMIALQGKKLKISKTEKVTVVGRTPGTTRNTYIYTVDIAE